MRTSTHTKHASIHASNMPAMRGNGRDGRTNGEARMAVTNLPVRNAQARVRRFDAIPGCFAAESGLTEEER